MERPANVHINSVTNMDRWGGFLGRNSQTRKRGMCVSVVVLGTMIGCALLAYTALASPTKTNEAVIQQVAFIFRHGDRTPTETYPNDPYLTFQWEDGWGALTKKGMLQLYNVGQWIRKEYKSITGNNYQSSNTLIRSSYADRCIMSAQALLAGLYPPSSDDVFLPGLHWRPVPVHSIPRTLDKMIVVKAPCPRLENELKEAYANESAKSNADIESYYRELTRHTGQPVQTITDVEFLYNTLEIEEQRGLALPEWTKDYYNNEMRMIAARSLAIFTSNKLQRRLRGGPLLKEILERMKEVRITEKYRRAYLYSAHDITLVNVLRAMGFTDELFKPDYGAVLIFELHLSNGGQNQEIRFKYLNSSQTTIAHPLKVPNCEEPCLLNNLINAWNDVIPENWDAECKL